MDESPLTISHFSDLLALLQQEYGDIPVVLRDADTGWKFLLMARHVCVVGGRLEIGVKYADERESL